MKLKPPYLGVAYYPEDWPEEEMDKDIAKMGEIGINVARIAEFAWHRMEPQEGKFDMSFFHKVVDKLGAAGIGVVLGTPTATPPAWFLRKYPLAAMEMENGARKSHGGRRHCCSNNPDFNAYSMRIVEAMAKEFADDPAVIGWQIDNEIYAGDLGCCCPICLKKFQERMKQKFGTIDALNEAWNLNLFSQWYDDFESIPVPRNAWHNPHLIMEWHIFQNESHIGFIHRQAEILHKYVKVPIGTDTMPVGAMDYRHMTSKLDVVQFNHYNKPENLHEVGLWFDFLRTLKPVPFWNTETATCWNGSTGIPQSIKPEGYCRANSWMPIALGAEANMYWLWRAHWAGHELMHGSVLDTSGREMLTTGEVRDVAAGFAKAADFVNGTKVKTDVALHFTSLSWNMVNAQPIVSGLDYAANVKKYWYKPLIDAGLRPDVIDAVEAVDKYKVIFTPMIMALEGDLGARMTEWVKNGGTWVVGPLSDVRNEDGARWRDRGYGMLEELTGVKWKFHAPDTEGHIKAQWTDGSEFIGNTWFEMLEGGADALVKVTEGHSAIIGTALLTRKQIGKGQIILLGTFPSEADMNKIIAMTVADSFRSKGSVFVAPRAGEAGEGVMLVEYGNAAAEYKLEKPATDILTGESFTDTVKLEPYGVRVLKY